MPDKIETPGSSKEKRFTDEQTDKRIYEHLTNEHDKISEEDISNVKTDDSILTKNLPDPINDPSVLSGQKNTDSIEANITILMQLFGLHVMY